MVYAVFRGKRVEGSFSHRFNRLHASPDGTRELAECCISNAALVFVDENEIIGSAEKIDSRFSSFFHSSKPFIHLPYYNGNVEHPTMQRITRDIR